jgi:hypothetical protein
VASLDGDNLLVFYYPSVSEIWSDDRDGLWWEWDYCTIISHCWKNTSLSLSHPLEPLPCTMNLSTADLRNYRTEFHETWWSYRYMFLVDPKVFRFVVKGGQSHIFGGKPSVEIIITKGTIIPLFEDRPFCNEKVV